MVSDKLRAVTLVASLTACISLSAIPTVGAAPPIGDPRRGETLYETKCGACHSLDSNRIGPAHRGVFGRKAGSVSNYAYSPTLKTSGLVWTSANLDLWLSGPTKMVKGTKMGFQLASPQDRADVIAYLRQVPPTK